MVALRGLHIPQYSLLSETTTDSKPSPGEEGVGRGNGVIVGIGVALCTPGKSWTGASAVCVSMSVTSVGVLRGVDVTVGVSVFVRVGLTVGLAVGISGADTSPVNEQASTDKATIAIKPNFRICSRIRLMILRRTPIFIFDL